MRAAFAFIVAFAAATPLAAQPRVTPQQADALSIRAEGFFAGQWFTAADSFDATTGTSFGPFYGGGFMLAERGFFLDVGISHFSKTGQRVFVSNGQAYPLNIPLTVSVTPVEFTFGYRFRRRHALIPYFGGGVGSYGYKESSPGAESGDDVDAHHAGYLAVGGAEFRFHKWVGVAADVQYTHIPGILGEAGVSKEFGESDLGGVAFRIKVLVGTGR